jgi:hypothetical protein
MSEAPSFPASEGEFAVDYRSYDGNIVLGDGEWTFQTHWSTAGTGSIHAYRDGGPRVAVAPGMKEIEAITAKVFADADFTSRTRTPCNGEIVLWKNQNGYAAAVQILGVVVTAESEAGTELKARYRILTDKSCDFSKANEPEVVVLEAAIADALQAFGDLKDVPELESTVPGIGHNNPPENARLHKDDFVAVAEELRRALAEPKDENRLKQLQAVVGRAVSRIGSALAKRYAWTEEGYFNQLGALAAIATAALGGWAVLHGSLHGVNVAASALSKTLFGWP